MNNEFKSLREQIEISLDKYGYLRKIGNIGKYIHSDRESALLIDNLLRDNALSTTEMSIAFDVAQKRAVHSLLTWLVGLIFTEFGDVFNSIASIVEDTDDRMRFCPYFEKEIGIGLCTYVFECARGFCNKSKKDAFFRILPKSICIYI